MPAASKSPNRLGEHSGGESRRPHREELQSGEEWGGLLHELEQERAEFHAILQQMPCAVIVAEAPSGRVVFSNAEAARMYGRELARPRSLQEYPSGTAFHADGTPYEVSQYPLVRALLKGENVVGEEMHLRRGDGTLFPVIINASPVRDAAGRITAAVSTFYDFSDRKRIEREHRDLVQRQRAARLEAEAAQRRLTLLAEISQFLLASLDHQAAIIGLARMVLPALGDGCFVDIEDGDRAQRVAIAHISPHKRTLLQRLDERDGLTALVGRALTTALRTGRPQRGDLAAVDLGASSKDQDADRRALVDAIGPGAYMVVPLVTRGRVLGAIVFLVTEGDRRYSVADLDFAQHVARRAATAVDNLRLYEEARQARAASEDANRLKDEFLATLSHELRTPLNAILGWARMLRSRPLDAATREKALGTIERNALSQAQIVEDLLDVSRIITGSLRLNLQTVDLGALIEGAITGTRPAAEAKGIRVEASFRDLPRIIADHGRLQQVVWNLLSNAIKFTPSGGHVVVGAIQTGSEIEISVSDTGVGISPAFLPHVFDRFRQADSTTTRVHGGLGLGLAIVRHLVELHGGTVEAESAGPGLGATFTVRLPSRLASATPSPSLQTPGDGAEIVVDREAQKLSGIEVLVVDDEADARDLVASILRHHGATVTTAASADDAMALMAQATPGVLVADIAMPGQDGYALIRRVRVENKDVPAVALTAYARPEDRLRALDAGFDMHLAKPIEPAELVGAVADLVGRTP